METDDEPDDADGAHHEPEEEDHGEELGPMIGIYKPVSPYEVQWDILEQLQDDTQPSSKGKAKPHKKKAVKGRCNWRNPVGFMGSINLEHAVGHEPWPNDLFAVFTATQGGDSKELAWVDGVTLLSAEGGNLTTFILMIAFLRPHQDLAFDVDLQSGQIVGIYGPGGIELHPTADQVLLVEDVKKINGLRQAISEAFYSAKSPVPTTVADEDNIDFTGTRGRRDNEPVPQIAAEPRVAAALQELVEVVREANTRTSTMSEAEWNSRFILHKSTIKRVNMHQVAQASRAGSGFVLFGPLTDLEEEKRAAERQQAEEDERRRRQEEERRRKKDEDRRRRDEERRWQQEERRAQEQWWKAQQADRKGAKGKAKGGKGKGKEVFQAPALPIGKASGKGQERQPPPQRQPAGARRAEPLRPGETTGAPPAFGGPSFMDLPPPWVAVPDASTGRYYYWNQFTNEVSWTRPSGGAPDFGAPVMPFGGFDFGGMPTFGMGYF